MNTTAGQPRDRDLQQTVEDALAWNPEVDTAAIGVSVKDGVVTLTGQVPTYRQKAVAGKTALRTKGVTTIANDIVVHHSSDPRTDSDIAGAVQHVLTWTSVIPHDAVKADVEDSVVTLTGSLEWNYQREMAEHLVEPLAGVKAVKNRITLDPRPHASPAETQALVRRAIVRHAVTDARHIDVAADGTRVVLTGTVSSYAEKRQAEIAAWSSPNVDHVDNLLKVVTID